MKKNIILGLTLVITTVLMNGCKKGENDPFLSLKSRKARVAGEWTVSSYKYTSNSTSAAGGTSNGVSTTTETINGSSYNATETSTNSGTSETETSTGTVSAFTYTFEKDGTFTSTFNYNITSTETDQATNTTTTDVRNVTSSEEGTWSFLGKLKGEYKNKERIVLQFTDSKWNATTTSTTSSGGSSSSVTSTSNETQTLTEGEEYTRTFLITQLKGKEMLLEEDYSGNSNYNYNDPSQTYASTSSGGYSVEMTLTQD